MGAILSQTFTTNKSNYDLLNDNEIILQEIQTKANPLFGTDEKAYINASWSILLDSSNLNGVLINEETTPQQFMTGIYLGGEQSLKHLYVVDDAVSGILTINFN